MCVIVCVVNGQDLGLTGDSADTDEERAGRVLSVVHEGPAAECVMCVIVCVVNVQDVGLTGDSADTQMKNGRGVYSAWFMRGRQWSV